MPKSSLPMDLSPSSLTHPIRVKAAANLASWKTRQRESKMPAVQRTFSLLFRMSTSSYKDGLIRDIYLRQDRPGVAVVLECASLEDANKALAESRSQRPGCSTSRPSRSGRSRTENRCSPP
jgi:hypothetical protein